MTGAGSGHVYLAHEDTFAGSLADDDSDGTPEVYGMGRNDTITDFGLNNNLEDLSKGDSAWDVESLKQNFQGTITIEAALSADVHDEIEHVVFNDGGTGIDPQSFPNSARLFVGVTAPTGSFERELKGCVPVNYSIDYSQGEVVTYSVEFAFADEEPGSSIDLSTATTASDGSTVSFHGADLQIDGTSVEDMATMSLSIDDISRLQWGADPTANRGVIADPSATLDVDAILTTASRLDLARGGSTGAPPDQLSSVSGTLTLTSKGGTTVSTYNLVKIKPDGTNWNEVLGSDDTTDSTTFNVTGRDAVTVS